MFSFFHIILFTNFVPYIYPDNDNTKQPYQNLYCEIPDLEIIKRKYEGQLKEGDLVFFDYDGKKFTNIFLEGPAVQVFTGKI